MNSIWISRDENVSKKEAIVYNVASLLIQVNFKFNSNNSMDLDFPLYK